jgi:hypothetical protein
MDEKRQQNANILFWIQQQQRKVELDASGNRARLQGTRRLADVVRLAEVHLPAELRALKHSMPALKTLDSAVKNRIQEMVSAGLKEVLKMGTVAEAKKQRAQFMRECNVLRGKFGEFYRQADTESARHVYKLQKAGQAAETDVAEPPIKP